MRDSDSDSDGDDDEYNGGGRTSVGQVGQNDGVENARSRRSFSSTATTTSNRRPMYKDESSSASSSSSGREEGSNDDDDDVVIVDGSDDADAKIYSNDPSMPLEGKSVSRPNVDGGAKGGRRIASPARKTSHIHDEGKATDDDVGEGMENGSGIDIVIPHSLLNKDRGSGRSECTMLVQVESSSNDDVDDGGILDDLHGQSGAIGRFEADGDGGELFLC